MVDLIPRHDRFAADFEPRTLNELIQFRIDGRISRRDLIRRAAALSIAAPVVGVMLHATSDMAFGRPSGGRSRALRAFAQAQQTVPVTGPTEPAGAPRESGTLVTATFAEPDTLHPWLAQVATAHDVLTAIIGGLFDYDSNQQLIPTLATGFEISDDGLTYTFDLRQEVKWHNGDPFTGQDFIDSWKMKVNPDFGAFSVTGWEVITDVTAPDSERIVVQTSKIFAPFMSSVGVGYVCPSAAIAKGAQAFKEEFARAPYGNGPFKFVEWRPKEQIVVEKNPDYWGNTPQLDRIVYRVVPDDNTQLVQLRTGEIQLCGGSGALPPTRVDEALGIDGITVLEHATQDWFHLDLKHVDFLRMTKVRQALDFATPSQLIIERLLKGRALPSIGDQAPGSWAHNPTIEPRPYDVEQAKALLAEAGLTPGADGVLEGPVPTDDPNDGDGEVKPFVIQLWGLAGDSLAQQIVQVIAESWNSIGIKTEPMFQDESTIWGPEGYQFTPDMTACFYEWSNGNDPNDVFYWHSSAIPETPTGTGGNFPAYFHQYSFQEEIDDLTQRAVETVDQEERQEHYWQVQEVLHREVPVIFIYWGTAYPAVANNVGGFWPSAFNGLMWNAQDWYVTD
ncbi:MAG: ABC transporter substrate-binding protein [Thermomicrobiales bacterium]